MVLDHDQHQESLPGIRTDRNSLVVPWLGLRASTAGGLGSIPGQGTKIPQAAWCGKKQTNKTKQNRQGRAHRYINGEKLNLNGLCLKEAGQQHWTRRQIGV